MRRRSKVSGALDAADSFEAQGFPDADRCDVGLVDEIENTIYIILEKLGTRFDDKIEIGRRRSPS